MRHDQLVQSLRIVESMLAQSKELAVEKLEGFEGSEIGHDGGRIRVGARTNVRPADYGGEVGDGVLLSRLAPTPSTHFSIDVVAISVAHPNYVFRPGVVKFCLLLSRIAVCKRLRRAKCCFRFGR